MGLNYFIWEKLLSTDAVATRIERLIVANLLNSKEIAQQIYHSKITVEEYSDTQY